MSTEIYSFSLVQEGHTHSEDAMLITRTPIPVVALCDGSGNAERVAKRALSFLSCLLKEATIEQMASPNSWVGWVKSLDSALLGGPQSTLLVAVIADGMAFGVCCGDSRAYYLDLESQISILTDGAPKYRLGSGMASAFFFQKKVSGGMLLLMSDGAWTPLSPYVIRQTTVKAAINHRSEVPAALLKAASRAGRADDMSVICVRTT